LQAIADRIGAHNIRSFDANRISDALFGDTLYANVIMLGAAWQQGLVPVSLMALLRAIELNGVAVDQNKQAFACGRLAVADKDFVAAQLAPAPVEESLEQMIARRADFLTAYQDRHYAERYRAFTAGVAAAEQRLIPGSQALTSAVARSLFKLMSYKDEYEVARLHTATGLRDRLQREFEGDFAINYHLAPPLLPAGKDARGRPLKRQFGPWIEPVFALLARLKMLRATPLDVFGYAAERRMERDLIPWYEALVTGLLPLLQAGTIGRLVEIAALPMEIRGYGPVKQAAADAVKAKVESLRAAAALP
jgi:indolepyruvate ferredoxin oxidoreductase